jgi:glycosyltransferase involved in cell wall biosynthesis
MHRVLYLMANAVPGGAERATMLMLGSHRRERYEPGVLFFSNGPLVEEARQLGIRVHVLQRPMRLRNPLSVAIAISETASIIREHRYSLVHSCMSYPHLVGEVAARLAGVPAVLYQHGPVGTWMDGAATLVQCDRILVNSQFTAAEQRRCDWRTRDVTVAPYGIDLAIGDADRARLREWVNREHHLDVDAPLLGIIARFDPWKGIDIALRAVAPLLRARPTLRFLVVGGQYRHFHPTYGDQLHAIVREEGVEAQVIFTGYRLDVRPYYARLTGLVHASLQPEPFGLTIIEAMAARVPVIAARGGGPAEIIDEGVDGLLHTAGNVDELRAAMGRLLDDEPLRRSMIEAGSRKVEARYRPSSMMRTIEGVYDELLEDAA